MTVKEMKNVIEEECKKHPNLCINNGRCPIYAANRCCVVDTDDCDPNEVKLQYELVKGKTITEEVVTDNPVSHPSHYTQGGIECIDAMIAAFGEQAVAHFCMCNAFKYLWRHNFKNGLEDINKAEWYLNKYKELKYCE